MTVPVGALNAAPSEAAEAALLRCCASTAWARAMTRARPFASAARLLATADRIWWDLTREDWLEAFAGHPRIGEDVELLRQKFAATAGWSGSEQSSVAGASEATLVALATGNRAYEARFGYIFIVCASGKTAEEMLALLEARRGNDPAEELLIAAEQQRQITALRLEKLELP